MKLLPRSDRELRGETSGVKVEITPSHPAGPRILGMDTADDGVPPPIKKKMEKQQELDVNEPQPASYAFKFTVQLEENTVEISGRLNENSKNELIKMILENRNVQA